MTKIFYLHWHEAEARERAARFRPAGKVHVHWSTTEPPNLKDALPDIAIISLDRLPSHGRAVAEWLWEAKGRQRIPIIFEGGALDKVAATRRRFPRARFCTTAQSPALVEQLKGKSQAEADA